MKKSITFEAYKPTKLLPEIVKYNEEELVTRLQSRDQQAFSYLYDNYSAALNGIIYRMVENRELAEINQSCPIEEGESND